MSLDNVALVSHNNCMDGSTCAAVFMAAGGKRENVYFANPGHEESDEVVEDVLEKPYDQVILADISISSKFAEKVDKLYRHVALLDHHKSAIPLKKYGWCEIEVDNHRCGSKMLYDFLYKAHNVTALKGLVEAVDDHDRWVKSLPESDTVALLHDILGQELFIERFVKNPHLTLTDQERYLLKIEEYKKNKYIEQSKKNIVVKTKQVKGQTVKIAYLVAGNYQSSLGHAIYDDPALDVDAVVMVGTKSLSMRSKQSCPVDLSAVAKLNGGGGHKSAAGCSLNSVLGKDLLDLVIDRLKFE